MLHKLTFAIFPALTVCVFAAHAQDQASAAAPQGEAIDKRAFGVLPNYRTADGSLPFSPISAKYKMNIAVKDSFDGPLYIIGGVFATIYHIENQNPSFGQGFKGYAHRYVTSFADQ